jgi:phenylacetate 2-hydroxylase
VILSINFSWTHANAFLNSVRQRTVGSPARDYIPALRAAYETRAFVSRLLGQKGSFDEKEEKAREYRRRQQSYIDKMLGELKKRMASGDETPSILGNIFRQGLLSDEEVLLASYTGSMSSIPRNILIHITY